MLEVHRETRRRVQFLIAAKSMKRRAVGFFAGLMSSSKLVPLGPRFSSLTARDASSCIPRC